MSSDSGDKIQIVNGDGCFTMKQIGNGCTRIIVHRGAGNESNIIVSHGTVTSIVISGRGSFRNIKFRVITLLYMSIYTYTKKIYNI